MNSKLLAPWITKLLTHSQYVLFTLLGLITAFWISWHALASVNFTYSTGYHLLNIEQHIDRFGPTNRFRRGFEDTEFDQHQRLFSEIVTAIQQGGQGLASIEYHLPNGRHYTLLREPEVIHLQDVANLVTTFNWVAAISTGLFAGLIGWCFIRKLPAPRLPQVALGLLGIAVICGLILVIFGPTNTFYWLHTKIFPHDHQWFFYYQESLMTTLMKAPDLFGYIAAVWAIAAIVIFIALVLLCQRILRTQ